jgi:hypothetical protein
MPTREEVRDVMMCAGNRLLAAQAVEGALIHEKAYGKRAFQEIWTARASVDALAEEYLHAVRLHRQASVTAIKSLLQVCEAVPE